MTEHERHVWATGFLALVLCVAMWRGWEGVALLSGLLFFLSTCSILGIG